MIYSLMMIYITFFIDVMGILSVDLNIINLDGTNYDEDYPETITHFMSCQTYGLA